MVWLKLVRSLLVGVSDKDDKYSLLSRSSKLHQHELYKNVYFAPDRTKSECNMHSRLVEEFRSRRSNGEKDLVIKNNCIIFNQTTRSTSGNGPATIKPDRPGLQSKKVVYLESNLNLAVVNCCSVFNKQAELEAFLTLYNMDIFCGSKSHLDSSILKFFQKIIMLIGLTEIDMEEVYSF